MCSLIVLRGLSATHPLIVAANRDEQVGRKAAPPGSFHGEVRRVLSPRDRVAGGTWLGVNDLGRFAGLTNVYGEPVVAGAPSRGHLPHLALDHDDFDKGIEAVMELVTKTPHSGFQLIVADADRIVVIRNAGQAVTCDEWSGSVICITNEHAAGEWTPRFLEPALAPELDLEQRFAALQKIVKDRGDDGHHTVCKHGDTYGTVSSSLIALAADGVAAMRWLYAPGPPDTVAYRNYSNLAQRLV